MEKQGAMLKPVNKRLNKGMPVNTTATYCLVFDTTVGDFLEVADLVGLESEDAD
jgi:hypothetical protein